jgi:hypothetical protein
MVGSKTLGRKTCSISLRKAKAASKPIDHALNIYRTGHPLPSASSDPENTVWQAVDGREWYFPEMVRGWLPDSTAGESWYEVAFAEATDVKSVALCFYSGDRVHVPDSFEIQAMDTHWWTTIYRSKGALTANTENAVAVKSISTNRLRIVVKHSGSVRLVSFKAF